MSEDTLVSNMLNTKLTDREYEVAMAITHLLKAGEKLGIKDDTELEGTVDSCRRNNRHIIKYAVEIYKVWAALYPQEHRQFIKDTEYELDVERPVKAAIKAGGYSPLSYPVKLDGLYHTLIPKVKTQDRRFWIPLLSEIPELRRSNYV